MEVPKLKKRKAPIQIVGNETSTQIPLEKAYVPPFTSGEQKYISTVQKLDNLFSPAQKHFHNVALRMEAGVDGKKKNKNVKRKSRTSKMVKGIEFVAVPAAAMSRKAKSMAKVQALLSGVGVRQPKKKATRKAAQPRVQKPRVQKGGPRKKYTKSQKFLEYHAKRSQRAHDKKLNKYIGTARGLGKPNEVKRLRNKLAWCKKYATAIENKVKL
jgi:hypothetical protein